MKKILIILLSLLALIALIIVIVLIVLLNSYIEQNKLNKLISWESLNGPPGGQMKQLIQNPSRHDELYATVSRSSDKGIVDVYKSEDKGESWKIIDELKDIQVSSIALFQDKLFVCGRGVYYYDTQKNLKKILRTSFNSFCNKAIVSDNKLFVTFFPAGTDIRYTDLTTGDFKWNKISFSDSELKDLVSPPEGIGYHMEVPNILARDSRILANVVVNEDSGSGQYTNDQLYLSEDVGKTWSRINLEKPNDVIISNIIQEPGNPEHIFLTLQHNIMHEFRSPISGLLKESFDGGKTWQALTDLDMESNAVFNVAINGSVYYLLCPYDYYILKLDGSKYERIEMPKIKGFEEILFGLDALLFDFDNPDIVYGKVAPVWSLGLIKSEDGMKTWKKMDSDIVGSSRTIMAVHPEDPDTIFTSGNIIQESYLTRDSGKTWEPFSPINSVDEVRVDPHDPNHILVISEMTGLYESNDVGETFKRINQDFSSAKIFDFEIAKDNPEKIYVSNSGVGISEYDPWLGRDPWRYVIGSPDYVYDFEIDPEDSDSLYAAYSPKIFENYSSIWRYSKSQKENFGWSELFRIENSRGITSLRFDPKNSNKMYAGVIGKEGTIYSSSDKGKTWQKLNEDLTFTTIWGHSQLQTDPNDKDTVYAGTWGGRSYKTTDGGKNWTEMDKQHTFSPTCLAISQKDPNVIYACDRTGPKIHKSTDAGKTWQEYYNFGEDYMLTSAVLIDPDDSDTIYASAFQPPMAHLGSLIKIKNGQKVADLANGLPRSVIEMEIDAKNKNILYAATHIHGVYKSTDAGINWEKLDDKGNGLPRTGFYDIDVDPKDSHILYGTALCGALPDYMMPSQMIQLLSGFLNIDANAKCGVYKSTDQGETWNLILPTISEARGIDIDPKNNNNLYVADMMGGVWVSNDAGQNWRQENNGLGSISMTSVKIKDNNIYASTQGSGVYAGVINKNDSITWDRSRSNKPKTYVYKIQVEIDPANPNRIYASAFPGGLLRSDDGGKHWNDKNFLTPSIKVQDPLVQGYYAFDINPKNPNIIWMGVYGKGMLVSYDGMDFDMFANGDDNIMSGKHITSVRINPQNPNEIYAGTQEGIFVTQDSGKHWQEMNDGLRVLDIRSFKISGVEYPPFNDDFEDGNADDWQLEGGWSVIDDKGNYVLEGTEHKWASAGQESWTDYTLESRVKLVEDGMHVNFRFSQTGRYGIGIREGGLNLMKTIFPNTHTQLVQSEFPIGKNVWNKIKIVGKGNNIKVYVNGVLKINYTDSEPLLSGRIAFESFDNSNVYVDDVKVTVDKGDNFVYAGTAGYGAYKLNSATKKWQNLGRTLGSGWWSAWDRRMYQFSSILFDPDIPGRIYYGHFPAGFFISEDNGKTWEDSSLGLGNDGIFSLTMHPTNHNILFAGTYNGVSKSVDRGKTWTIKSDGMPPEQWPYTVAIDSDNPDVMYTSTKNGKNKGFCDRNRNTFCGVVMKSTDGGESWVKIMKGLNPISEFYTLIIYPPNHNILFLSTNRGVYLSRDAGKSWKPINSGLPAGGLPSQEGISGFIMPLMEKFLPMPTSFWFTNQVRDNVADNLALTPDNKYLILGLVNYGAWKADLTKLEEEIKP